MSLPTATCISCGQEDIEISSGPTGKPLIDCPQCGSQNVIEQNQSQLTCFYKMNVKNSTKKSSRSRNVKKEEKHIEEHKADPNEEHKDDQDNEEKKDEDITESESGETTVLQTKPKKKRKINEKNNENKPKHTRISKSIVPSKNQRSKKQNDLHAIMPNQCWKCDAQFNFISFKENHITSPFFCCNCGIPQTFQCKKCHFMNSLLFDFCIFCGQKPIAPNKE